MNQKGFIAPLIAIILIIAASIGGYVFLQYRKMNDENVYAPVQHPYANTPQSPAPIPNSVPLSPTPTTAAIPADWKTYRNEKYGFEMKYPNNLYPKIPSPINNYLLYVQFIEGESEMVGLIPMTVIVKKCEGGVKSCALDPNLALAEFKVFSLDQVEIHQYHTSGWGGRIYINGIFQKNNLAYNIAVKSSSELPNLPTPKDLIYFKQILSTFKFTK